MPAFREQDVSRAEPLVVGVPDPHRRLPPGTTTRPGGKILPRQALRAASSQSPLKSYYGSPKVDLRPHYT